MILTKLKAWSARNLKFARPAGLEPTTSSSACGGRQRAKAEGAGVEPARAFTRWFSKPLPYRPAHPPIKLFCQESCLICRYFSVTNICNYNNLIVFQIKNYPVITYPKSILSKSGLG